MSIAQRLSVGIIAAMFGFILVSTGKKVYDMGNERLKTASEEMCTLIQKEKNLCTYECGGLLSATKNCTGYSYKYLATSKSKCGNKTLAYNEYVDLLDKGNTMCRCGLHEQPGDCWVDLPAFSSSQDYPCTVENSCVKFDFSSPSDYETTGLVNVLLGLMFIFFACCPETCVFALGTCSASCANAIIPAASGCLALIILCLKKWLVGIRDFTEAPASGYLSDEVQPLL